MIRTRFAPSPTGMMHIGGVRTALYAFLVARQNEGKFTLRIEDTDRNRFVPGATEDIIQNINWLGLDFDEEPIIQSERKEIYQKYAKELTDKGLAYEQEGAIWFKMPKEGQVKFTDLIGGREVSFNLADQKDFVLLKSDGFPTYHLAHVVDDHLMETNPVIRGDEWLPSMPKHILTFKAFGWEVPHYAHLPLIVGTDKAKLSKRHGAKPVGEFRSDGFLPEAILNYMALLGWTPPGDKEIISLDEMIKAFQLKGVHSTPAVFDVTKLEWMNGEYIRQLPDEELTKRLQEFLAGSPRYAGGAGHPAKEKLVSVVPLVKERIKKLSDFIPLTDFLFEKPEYDLVQFEKLKIKNLDESLEEVLKKLTEMEKPWQSDTFEKTFRELAEELKLSVSQMFQLIRVAVSGQTVTPPLFESIEILGEDVAKSRIEEAIKFLRP
ncbi:MAG: glutamate--tRNA ligase [Candidatus Daviesbacteria bacterium]|nr:glutamate--tRNA ligase [Candidatus Daviesbacteria bacterium]